jgi:curli biogenesis system outer membrane secretion channel CsgG
VVATLEDQLVSSLVGAGFRVMERDPDGVMHLMRETEAGDRYSLLFRETVSDWPVTDVTVGALKDPELRVVVRPTALTAADYLITYRILELGLVYKDNRNDYREVVREGRVRLHVRVTEADTGRILFAENVDGTFEDSVRKVLVEDLESYHYSFFGHELPLQDGAADGAGGRRAR